MPFPSVNLDEMYSLMHVLIMFLLIFVAFHPSSDPLELADHTLSPQTVSPQTVSSLREAISGLSSLNTPKRDVFPQVRITGGHDDY